MKLAVIVVCSFFVLAYVKASPYNKYGRTCRDILCVAGQEECVMESDACTAYSEKCGSYPTCKRKAGTQKRGCASVRCASGEFCSIRQENCTRPPCEIKPVCIAFRKPTQSSTSAPVLNRAGYRYNNYNNQRGQYSRNSWSYDNTRG